METLTLQLLVPIKVASLDYTEITLREPTAGDMEAAQAIIGGGTSQNIKLISLCANLPLIVCKAMSARDHQAAIGFLFPFMKPAPQTID